MNFGNQYLSYEEYQELEGKLSEMPFNLLEFKAQKEVDSITFNRFKKLSSDEYPNELKLCVNELISELNSYNTSGNIASESVGNYAVSYNKPISSEEKKVITSIITTYLSEIKVNDVPVLYCGADVNEE